MNSRLHASTFDDRQALAPPKPPGLFKAFLLAIAAHLLLLLALMHGLQWKRATQNVAAEAELWSAAPQEAAPKPEPTPPPAPPAPVVRPPPAPDPQLQRDAQIALEREKKRREEELREQAERRQAQREREKKRKAEEQRRREEAEARKQEQARLLAEAKRRQEDKQRREQEAQDKRLAQLREENLRRMQGMAGTGSPAATGSAAQASGPSAGWAARVQARVRPNIVFTDAVTGNPKAEVEVRTAPDGTIVARKLVRSSGVKAWDDAVLRALDKTEVLPRDTDGRVPSPVTIEFRPRN